MSTLSQYSDLTYLIELIALGLVVAALLAVTFSIFTRQGASKREQKKILSLRRTAEQDKEAVDRTLAEINNIGKQIKEDADEAQQQLTRASKKASEIEQRAEAVATIELDMKQLIEATTERINHIQEYWEQQLEETTTAMSQINSHLENGLKQTAQQGIQAETLLKNLSRLHAETTNEDGNDISTEIKETLNRTLVESKELLNQLKEYKQQATSAYQSFTLTLSDFEKQTHEQFDDIFNSADIARQELNANLDESRKYMEVFRDKDQTASNNLILEGIDKKATKETLEKPDKSTTKMEAYTTPREVVTISDEDKNLPSSYRHRKRPIIGMTDAEDLTDPSLIKEYGPEPIAPANEDKDKDKNLVSLFSKFRQHGS